MAEDTKPTGGQSLFWLVYGQVAALLGAVSLFIFLNHLLDLGVSGFIRDALDAWAFYVRPVVAPFFNQYESVTGQALSTFWRDYLTLGLISIVSYARTRRVYGDDDSRVALDLTILLLDVATNIFTWPISLLKAALEDYRAFPDRGLLPLLLTASPLIYLGLLFVANAWLV